MTVTPPELPADLEASHAVILRIWEELQQALATAAKQSSELADRETVIAKYLATITEQEATIESLSEDNKLLRRSIFGSRRERVTEDLPEQKLLFPSVPVSPEPEAAEPEQPSTEDKPKKRTSKGRGRRVFPETLPREQQRYPLKPEDIPDDMQNNPNARRFFKKVGETLEVVPMRLTVIEHLQEVIALDQSDEATSIVAAKRPTPLINSFAGTSLLAYLTVSRFADHLPYYRLEDILGRSGYRIERSTLARWMHRIAEGVDPLVDLMWSLAKQSLVLCLDETPVTELRESGGSLKGYLWAAVGDHSHPYDCFFYSSSRQSLWPESFLAGFQGYLVADAYVGYERIGDLWDGVAKASCWVHARRKFEACHHLGATPATRAALSHFRRLFDIEDRYRECDAATRQAARQEQSMPIVESFHDWLQAERMQQLPKAKLSGAINYMLNRWESFTRFLESGEVPMDNNAAERAVKYPILGRKAWLFVGNQLAGETAARLFTLTKTCNRLRIDPFAYLQDVYARLPTLSDDELPSLLPDRWLAEHPQHLIQARVHEAYERAQRTRERRAERRQAG